ARPARGPRARPSHPARPSPRLRSSHGRLDRARHQAGPLGSGHGAPHPGPPAGRGFAAVLFDLDGTLVDSTPAVERSWYTVAGEHGVELTTFGTFHGIPPAQAGPKALGTGVDVAAAVRRLEALEIAD